ncbi:hypothetical protein FE257_011017 [Aspergillus nanangensis]|uniref:Uncharacterized protein n=1 Tax=Aspergillus nanangensis TaxID=2582783 RepID=A0AAD4CI27_ASPNN|nr:hypothetical protein FE257_011017 [Aspergillus nanangensis]
MSFRQKVRKVFHRQSSNAKSKDNGIKIEYYKRHEIPRSKFKGPFDPEHQQRLASWSFGEAHAIRERSLDLSLSPCTSLPDYLRTSSPSDDDGDLAPDDIPPGLEISLSDASASDEDRDNTSSSSTAVDSDESHNGSLMTLLPTILRVDSITQIKESIRHTSPAIRIVSPPPITPRGTYMPFSPEDLTRALNAVQICT